MLAASIIALMMEAASTCEKSVNLYQTTRCNNPQASHLQKEEKYVKTNKCSNVKIELN
jgi:hypothetical protein